MVRRIFAAAATLVLSACAQIPAERTDGPLGPAVDSFNVVGRLMLRQGERRDHLRIDWEHTPRADELMLTTPLGQGVARLSRDGGGALLEMADGRRLRAADWRALAADVVGTALPLDELPEWLRGARPRRTESVEGWRVEVVEAAPYRHGVLPRVIEARRGEVELRLVVDERLDGND